MLPSSSPPERISAFTRPLPVPLSPIQTENDTDSDKDSQTENSSSSKMSQDIDDLKLSIESSPIKLDCEDRKSCSNVECQENNLPFLQINKLLSVIHFDYEEKCRELEFAQIEIQELHKQLEYLHSELDAVKTASHQVNVIYQDRIVYQERIVPISVSDQMPMGRILAIDEKRSQSNSDILHEFGL